MAPTTRKGRKKNATDAAAAAAKATDNENADLKKQLAELKKQMNDQKRQVLGELPKKKDATAQDKFRRVINEAIRQGQWRYWKFVPKDDTDEKTIAKEIYKAVAAEYPIYHMEDKSQRNQFIEDHLPDFATELNNVRAYVTSRIKDSCKAYFLEHGKMPDIQKIKDCATRNLDLNNPEDVAHFDWYWEDLLVKATGNKADWDIEKRWYATITDNAPPDSPDTPYVTPETEAFAVLCVENHHKTWGSQFKLKAEGGKKTKLLAPKKEHEDATAPIKEGDNIYMCGPDFETKWTETTRGSSKFGGYSDEGTDVYRKYKKEIKNARKQASSKELEATFLNIVRKKHKISAPSHLAHKAKKRRKNKEQPVAPAKKYVSLIDSDYEFSSSDEEAEFDE